MFKLRFFHSLKLGDDLLGESLSELDTPLVE
jgi:hypothetical protein